MLIKKSIDPIFTTKISFFDHSLTAKYTKYYFKTHILGDTESFDVCE